MSNLWKIKKKTLFTTPFNDWIVFALQYLENIVKDPIITTVFWEGTHDIIMLCHFSRSWTWACMRFIWHIKFYFISSRFIQMPDKIVLPSCAYLCNFSIIFNRFEGNYFLNFLAFSHNELAHSNRKFEANYNILYKLTNILYLLWF